MKDSIKPSDCLPVADLLKIYERIKPGDEISITAYFEDELDPGHYYTHPFGGTVIKKENKTIEFDSDKHGHYFVNVEKWGITNLEVVKKPDNN